ncbi:4-alpha-glucanotransferase [Ornithinimicrobium sediminis]|uniref:4-alpha-glucanotransferase n=1 Tax=Ornithinimicrobium sediminis TaxID=2904603 RepID=UPI001E53F751|nr:4-alpha-glucanotransferase [Ornithinimicrobium sediminis]
MTEPLPASLTELAHAHGVATEFWDWQGRHTLVSAEAIRAVLWALGVDASDDEAATAALAERQVEAWRRALPPVYVVPEGREPRVPLHVDAGQEAVLASVRLESGEVRGLWLVEGERPTREVDGVTRVRLTVGVPGDLPLGWHEIEVTPADASGDRLRMPLVVYPNALELPPALQGDGTQRWGLMTQLYAMRSAQSWGVGDLADLGDAGAWAAGLGADFVLVNPLHAAEPVPPLEPSPYLPTSRRFVSPLYIRVEDVPEVAYLSAAERQLVEWHSDDAKRFLELEFLERDAVWVAKEAALRLVFRQPRSLRRERNLHAYIEREGQGLIDYATWCVLVAEHGQSWRDWPEELHDPQSPAVESFREQHSDAVEFHCWMQWVLSEQLAKVQKDLVDTGMQIGVVHDLAVGVHPTGADSWILGSALARGVTVGAPGDQYNQRGQDWSQPPWRPDRLAEAGFAPYRDMLRNVLRDAGGLRVDHVIGLFRLWWIPEGMEPHQGTYVRYDHDAMIGILMLEAQRAGAVVVGEDLGTVEPWVRDYLRERGILGTSILWFERDEHGPLAPERYRELCLATVTTHDLPPTAGYLDGVHLDLRHNLGLLTRPLEEERAEDEGAREEVLQVLRDRGLLRPGAGIPEQVEALHRYLTWSPARMLGVSVSDLAQDRRIINQPGTDEEYPNWRVPLAGPEGRPVLLEDLFTYRSARRLARTVSRRS